jgi:hypothetical protein
MINACGPIEPTNILSFSISLSPKLKYILHKYIYDCDLEYADGDRDSKDSKFQIMRSAFFKLHPEAGFPPNNKCNFAPGELSSCPFFEEQGKCSDFVVTNRCFLCNE